MAKVVSVYSALIQQYMVLYMLYQPLSLCRLLLSSHLQNMQNISRSTGHSKVQCMCEAGKMRDKEPERDLHFIILNIFRIWEPIPKRSETPSPCLFPFTFLLLCRALLWADYISICTKLAISSCLLTPQLVPARGIPVARECVEHGTLSS